MSETETASLDVSLNTQVVELTGTATALKVVDNATYERAGLILQQVAGLASKIKSFFKPHRERAHAAHAALCKSEKDELAKLDPLDKHLRNEVKAYNAKLEAARRAEQARLDAEAREAARAAREKAEAETRALQAEADRKALEARNAEIARLQAEGQTKAAMAAAAAPVVVTQVAPVAPAPVARFIAPDTKPKVAGLSDRMVWQYRVTDLSLVPLQYLALDTAKVRAEMNASKGQAKIPGIEFFQESTTVVGR